MGDSDKFVLRWNDFEKNIVGAYKGLRNDKNFQDVSLVCQGGTFSAHRVILSACSPVFLEMIREITHHHPVVFMRGVKSQDMAALLDFMYHGEASVAESELERFLAVAEDLEVRGLTGAGEERQETDDGERRVSDVDLDTAVDDDVNSLLAGLDDQPPPKRVKQERHESQLGFTITTPSGASVQDRGRVKVEQSRAALSSSLSTGGVTPSRPASATPTHLDRMRTPVSSLQSNPVSSIQPRLVSSPQARPPPQYAMSSPVQRASNPAGLPSPLLQSVPHAVLQAQLNPGPRPPPPNYQMFAQQPDPRLVQVEHSKDGSPPVLHLPDRYGMAGAGGPNMPGGSEDVEYHRNIEALIERGEGNSKLSCKSCTKTVNTKNKATLVAHIESVHLKAEIKCGSCNKTFKATSYLKQHQKRSGCTGQ